MLQEPKKLETPEVLFKQLQNAKGSEQKQKALENFLAVSLSSEQNASYFARNYEKIKPYIEDVFGGSSFLKMKDPLTAYYDRAQIAEQIALVAIKTGSTQMTSHLAQLSKRSDYDYIVFGMHLIIQDGQDAELAARNYSIVRPLFKDDLNLLFELGKAADSEDVLKDMGKLLVNAQNRRAWLEKILDSELDDLGLKMKGMLLEEFSGMYGKLSEKSTGLKKEELGAIVTKLTSLIDKDAISPEQVASDFTLARMFISRLREKKAGDNFKIDDFQKAVLREIEKKIEFDPAKPETGKVLVHAARFLHSEALEGKVEAIVANDKQALTFAGEISLAVKDYGQGLKGKIFEKFAKIYKEREEYKLDGPTSVELEYCLRVVLKDPAFASKAVYGKDEELSLLFAENIKLGEPNPKLRAEYEKIVNGIFERAMGGDAYFYRIADRMASKGICHTEPEKHYDKLLELVKKEEGHVFAYMIVTAILKKVHVFDAGDLLDMFEKFNDVYENCGTMKELSNLSKVNALAIYGYNVVNWPHLASEAPRAQEPDMLDKGRITFHFLTHNDIMSRLVRANIWSMLKDGKPDVPAILEFVKEEPTARDYFLMSIGNALDYSEKNKDKNGKVWEPALLYNITAPLAGVRKLQSTIEQNRNDPSKEAEVKEAEEQLEKGKAMARRYVADADFDGAKSILSARLKNPYTARGAKYLLDLVEQYETIIKAK
jgi:hypothetical protein